MCNLYSMTRNPDAIRQLFRIRQDMAGNLPLIFPDAMAPVVRVASTASGRGLSLRRGAPASD